jgi:ketosteroid isomerase-like protein
MRLVKLHHLMFLVAILLLVATFTHAQTPAAAKDPMLETVTALDTKLFDAYNHCDLKTLGEMVSDDLEFYHDITGLAVGKASFVDSIQKNICGKVQRTIVPGTLEAHALKGFGAVELVKHRFHHPDHDEDGVGEAESVMLWENKNGTWKLTRVISYDHHPAK